MPGSAFIDDGWTLVGRWPPAADGRYPGGQFRYRLALPRERDRYRATVHPSQIESVRTQILLTHVIDVTIDDPDVEPSQRTRKLSAQDWALVRPDIRDAILDAVLDYTGPERLEKNSDTG